MTGVDRTGVDRTGVDPKRLARTAGALYLVLGILTGFAGAVEPRVYVAGDAAATAGHLARARRSSATQSSPTWSARWLGSCWP